MDSRRRRSNDEIIEKTDEIRAKGNWGQAKSDTDRMYRDSVKSMKV